MRFFFLFSISYLISLSAIAQYKFSKEISARADSIPQFSWLHGVAVDTLGNIYLAEHIRKTVVVLDSTGKISNEFSTKQNNSLYDIAVDDSLNIYVATLGSGITKMNKNGTILLSNISNNGVVVGVSVDHSGYIYALIESSYSVRKYNKNGILVNTFGGSGTSNGKFSGPVRRATVDEKNNVYITAGSTIHKFDSTGQFIKRFGGPGGLDGQFYGAEGIIYNKNKGNLVICDFSHNRVQIFDTSGIFLNKFGMSGLTDGKLYYPTNVALDKYSNIFIVDDKDGFSNVNSVQKFSYSGNFIRRFGINGYEDSLFYLPTDIKIDSKGNFNVLDAGKSAVLQFDSTWKFIKQIGYYSGLGIDSSFQWTNQIRIDHQDNLYVWDSYGNNSTNRIQRFLPNGTFDSSWVKTSSDTVFAISSLVAFDEYGNKYVSNYNVVNKYTNNVLCSTIGEEGIAPGKFISSQGICIGKNKKMYVSDSQNSRVQIFIPSPKIKVKVDTINITNAKYTYQFGSTQPTVNISKQFVIENVGNTNLVISAIDIQNSNPSFSIDDLNTTYTISHDNSTTINLLFNPISLGNQTDTILFTSNSNIDSRFEFGLYGTTKGVLNVKVNNLKFNYGEIIVFNKTTSETEKRVVVKVENLGYEDLIIDSLSCIVGCSYFNVDDTGLDYSIPAFSSSTFDIVYSTSDLTIKQSQIVIYSKDSNKPVFLIATRGTTVTSIDEIGNINEMVNLFPNPTSHIINIHSISNIENVRVFNVIGDEILNFDAKGNTQLDISSLSKGLYNFVIKTDKGIGTRKISIQ